MTDLIDQTSVNAILASQLQDVEDLKRFHPTEDQTDQTSLLKSHQDECKPEFVRYRDHHVAHLYDASPLTDEQLPEVQPVATITPVAGAVERPHSPDDRTRNHDNTHQNGSHQDGVQQNGACHSNTLLDDTHQDATQHNDTSNNSMYQIETRLNDMQQGGVLQEAKMKTAAPV